jgi:hypothetical protein
MAFRVLPFDIAFQVSLLVSPQEDGQASPAVVQALAASPEVVQALAAVLYTHRYP